MGEGRGDTHPPLLVLVADTPTTLPPALVAADIQFSRSVTKIADDSDFQLKFDNGCSSSDDYGSNDCTFAWGDEISGSAGGSLGHDLEEGSTFSVDVKIDKFVSWKFSCAACGSNCTTTIPVVNQDVNFAMPDCPIPATGERWRWGTGGRRLGHDGRRDMKLSAGGAEREHTLTPSISADVPATVFDQALPADSPVPVKVTVTGTVGVKDAAGDDVLAMSIDATVQ